MCPPAAETRISLALGAPDRREDDRVVVGPRAAAPARASHSVTAAPPVTETFFSLPPAKNAIHWPSGEKNGFCGALGAGERRRPATGRACGRTARACACLSRDERERRAVRRQNRRRAEVGRQRRVGADAGEQLARRGRGRRSPGRPQRAEHGQQGRADAAATRPRQRAPPRRGRSWPRGQRRVRRAVRRAGLDAASSTRASPMSRSRCFGSVEAARARAAAAAAASSGRQRVQSTACRSAPRRACRRRRRRRTARCPVSISYSTTPNAQMSARWSTALPLRLLGRHVGRGAEDHARLRHRGRVIVGECSTSAFDARRAAGSIALARPKSSTFTVPSARTLMFAGLRSRWMMPCSCAASSASAICRAIGSASSSGIGPRAMCAATGRRPRPVPSRGRVSRARPPSAPSSSSP